VQRLVMQKAWVCRRRVAGWELDDQCKSGTLADMATSAHKRIPASNPVAAAAVWSSATGGAAAKMQVDATLWPVTTKVTRCLLAGQ
jgi:hypothetical protein